MLFLFLTLSAFANDSAKSREVAAPPGLEKSAIDAAIQKEMPKIVACYDDNVKGEARPAGRVLTKFTIGGDGKVGSAEVKQSALENVPVEACLTSVLKAITFPAPAGGGIVDVEYPFAFAPSKKPAKKKRK